MVGISGASESRCALTSPRIFTFLSRQSGSATLMLSMPSGMSPARMPVICVLPPRYGTVPKLVPAIMFNSPTLTCEGGRAGADLKRAGLRLFLLYQLRNGVHRDVDVANQSGRYQCEQGDRHEILEG